MTGLFKRAIKSLNEGLKQAKARCRAVKRGKAGVSRKRYEKIAEVLIREKTRMMEEQQRNPTPKGKAASNARFKERVERTTIRICIKYALDRIGILDRTKRRRIHKLMQDAESRKYQLMSAGRELKGDQPFEWITTELVKELGGRKKVRIFMEHLDPNWDKIRAICAEMLAEQ